jgi:DNA-binding transcriptional MerR regulator
MTAPLTPEEARTRLGVSARTFARYRAKGLIAPAFRTPAGHARYNRADVDALRKPSDPAPTVNEAP